MDPTVLQFIIDALKQRTINPDPSRPPQQGVMPPPQQPPAPPPNPAELVPQSGGGMLGGAGRAITDRRQQIEALMNGN
jgi:hypothetical protein